MAEMNAIQFDRYGDLDVLEVRRVPRPLPGSGEVLVKVVAAGINPGEAMIRKGFLHDRWPATFPSGEGSDFAGVVAEVGAAAWKPGDEVLGYTHNRASHAEYVVVPAEQVAAKPAGVAWEVAGGLFVAGTTAYAAVKAIGVASGDVVVVAGAAGGVGSIAVQLAKHAGATVLGVAGPDNDEWLKSKGVVPVHYGDGLAERLKSAAPNGRVNALLDFFGGGYVELAVKTLGVSPHRVDTIIDFAAVETFGVKAEGSAAAASASVLEELVKLVASGQLEVPIARSYPLSEVREAYRDLEQRHTRGKIVLKP